MAALSACGGGGSSVLRRTRSVHRASDVASPPRLPRHASSHAATASPTEAEASRPPSPPETARVAVLGATGYTGAEIVRLVAQHPILSVVALTGSERSAGKRLSAVFPHLQSQDAALPAIQLTGDTDWENVDAAFCCLPHGTTQEICASLPRHVKIVDLSADFRLRDPSTYKQWYGKEHAALDLQSEAVYGLTELYRESIKTARLVANPGCYPTSILLPTFPLLQHQMICEDGIIVDAKSGTSGAGRSAKEANLYCEVTEGLHAYGLGGHRHVPEIEQIMRDAIGGGDNGAKDDFVITFTPHLMPMSRGMLSTIYVKLCEGQTVETLRSFLADYYKDEEFVLIANGDQVPATRHVRGSNYTLINVFADRVPGRAIIVSAIDNLVKGASGQAIQNMNLILGIPERTGLGQQPLFP